MSFPVKLTLGTGNKVSIDYQSQDASVSITYELERKDTDILKVVEEKASELEQAHGILWRRLKELENLDGQPSRRPAARGHFSGRSPGGDEARQRASGPDGTPKEGRATEAQVTAIRRLAKRAGIGDQQLHDSVEYRFSKDSLEELTKQEASILIVDLQRTAAGTSAGTASDGA